MVSSRRLWLGLALALGGLDSVSLAKEQISNLCKYDQDRWKCGSISSSRDLENSLRFDVKLEDVMQCIRMSTVYGPIGCGGGGEIIDAHLRQWQSSDDELEDMLVVKMEQLGALLSLADTDSHKVQGVLAVSLNGSHHSDLFSPESKNPQRGFENSVFQGHSWNPEGSDRLNKLYKFPIWLTKGPSAQAMWDMAAENRKRKNDYKSEPTYKIRLLDSPAIDESNTSVVDRIIDNTCDPLGGYSVWSQYPPRPKEENSQAVIISAPLDAVSMFRDTNSPSWEYYSGADYSIFSLICLLTIADAMQSIVDDLSNQSPIILIAFAGEGWGYMGSRRYLDGLRHTNTSEFGGDWAGDWSEADILSMLEIGPISGVAQNGLYVHDGEREPSQSAMTEAILDAASNDTTDQVYAAAKGNGIPPSSLRAYYHDAALFANESAFISEFNSSFVNQLAGSSSDFPQQYSSRADVVASITQVAKVALRAVLSLTNQSELISTAVGNVSISMASELLDCLFVSPVNWTEDYTDTSQSKGMHCPLVKKYLDTNTAIPSHYIGVLKAYSRQPLGSKSMDVGRFVWNFLASKSVNGTEEGESCNYKPKANSVFFDYGHGDCLQPNEICIRATEKKDSGTCVVSITRFVPAFSKWLKPANTSSPYQERWIIPDKKDLAKGLADEPDKLYCESFGMHHSAYMLLSDRQNGMDSRIFAGGMTVFLISVSAVLFFPRVWKFQMQ